MSLQTADSRALQRRTWAFERVGWAVLALAIVAAAAGLFGHGPLSDRRAVSADGALAVEYQRFARVQSPERLRVRVAPLRAVDGRLRLALDARYLDRVTVEAVTPEPESVELAPGLVAYELAVAGSVPEATVTFQVRGEQAGRARAEVHAGEAVVRFEQFFFP